MRPGPVRNWRRREVQGIALGFSLRLVIGGKLRELFVTLWKNARYERRFEKFCGIDVKRRKKLAALIVVLALPMIGWHLSRTPEPTKEYALSLLTATPAWRWAIEKKIPSVFDPEEMRFHQQRRWEEALKLFARAGTNWADAEQELVLRLEMPGVASYATECLMRIGNRGETAVLKFLNRNP